MAGILGEELEAFRAAHDCEQETWDITWEGNKQVYHCEGCGKECFTTERKLVHRIILVKDLLNRIRDISSDIRTQKNKTVIKRLEQEQAAYSITLRNLQKYRVTTDEPLKKIAH